MRPDFVFDFPENGSLRKPLSFGAPLDILRADKLDDVRSVLRTAEARARSGAWVAGFVAYDAAPAFDPAFHVHTDSLLPLAWFGIFPAPLPEGASVVAEPRCTSDWRPNISPVSFHADIAAIRSAIKSGDVYQVNHTLHLKAQFAGDDFAWFRQLRSVQPNSYAAYLNLGRYRILSVAPELFFRRDGDLITAKPMKGTARRGRWYEEDNALAEALYNSQKDRAENLMIVDLMRNDLSRISSPHGVQVPHLFSIERYPTVLQMTSTITASTRPGIGLDEIFGAIFPCGSITGAPKVKAMEFIERLEVAPRGIYCGAIGLIKPGGDAVFNVAIRSVVVDSINATATCGVGAGITWDSSAADEYEETLLKARFLSRKTPEFELFETMRIEGGHLIRLDRHLARLHSSAKYFDFPFDDSRCRKDLAKHIGSYGAIDARIRLSLDCRGSIKINIDPLPSPIAKPAYFAVSRLPVSGDNIWLYHKTTHREFYEQSAAAHSGVFDVLLQNENGEITEFTRGNVVIELNGKKLTPPRECGLLAGCLRGELLDSGVIVEGLLKVDDLARADRVWFVNSLRGLIELHPQVPSST